MNRLMNLKTMVYGLRRTLLHIRRHEVSFCTAPDSPILFSRLADLRPIFDQWCQKYKKRYLSEEELRFKLVAKSYESVEEHNASDSSYMLKLNKFADLTEAEVKRMHSGLLPPMKRLYGIPTGDGLGKAPALGLYKDEEVELPLLSAVDWRKAGAVTAIKDQERIVRILDLFG